MIPHGVEIFIGIEPIDLRWSFGLGLLLMGAGFSIVVVQRRHRREGGR